MKTVLKCLLPVRFHRGAGIAQLYLSTIKRVFSVEERAELMQFAFGVPL
jgi:hypothetical protein